MPSVPEVAAWLALAVPLGCSGKEDHVVPVHQTSLSSGSPSLDSGGSDTGPTTDTAVPSTPDGPFWMTVTLTGGDPSNARDGQVHTLQSGSAQLTEDPSGFVLAVRFEDTTEGATIGLPCVVPLSFVGGLPAQNAETGRDGTDVGCPKVTLDGTLYAENLNGLTTITVNDGSTLHGTFQLDARSDASHLLVAEGELHVDLCDRFWDGTPCTW